MDRNILKRSVEKIEMPRDMEERIISGCRSAIRNAAMETEVQTASAERSGTDLPGNTGNLKRNIRDLNGLEDLPMEENRSKNKEQRYGKTTGRSGRFRRPAAIILILCLCFTAAAAAAGHRGFFSDIIRWDGAVTGTKYEEASEEINVSAVIDAEAGELVVTAELLCPDTAPYSEIEKLEISDSRIENAAGDILSEDPDFSAADIVDGTAEIRIPFDRGTIISSGSGEYTLKIDAFTGSKKADQPLEITGTWECQFSEQ